MSAIGTLQVRAYASYAQLPLENVAVTVTASDGTAIALRLTDRSGKIDPISIPVPDKAESQAPEHGKSPFAAVNVYAHLRGFEQVEAENVQIFADTLTVQNLEMVPLSEMPDGFNPSVLYDTPPQNL